MSVDALFFCTEMDGSQMKAAIVREIGSFEHCDVETPSPQKDEVLVKVSIAGLCRTDVKIIDVGHRDLTLPRIPAEEVVGTICEAGPNVDKSLVGRKVYVYPGISCGECVPCLKGAGNLCRSMQIMGFHRDGGFAEYVTAPLRSIIEIQKDTPFEMAIFAEPLSCCLNALEMARLRKDETIAVWGAGPAGTLLSRAAEALGAKPTVIETDERRRGLIDGVSCVPDELFDVAIPAVGTDEVYTEALKHLAPRGRMVCFSGLPRNSSTQRIDMNKLHYLEQTITGAYGCSYRHGVQALEMISTGTIDVEDMISHRLHLSQLGEALELVRRREGMKILIYTQKESV